MQVINKEEMGTVDLDGDQQLNEKNAQNCADSIKASFPFINIVIYGHEERLRQSNVGKLTFGKMSLILEYNSFLF